MLDNESQMVPCPEGTDKWGPPGWMKQRDSDTGPCGMNVPHIKIKLMQKLSSETEAWALFLNGHFLVLAPVWQNWYATLFAKGNIFSGIGFNFPLP